MMTIEVDRKYTVNIEEEEFTAIKEALALYNAIVTRSKGKEIKDLSEVRFASTTNAQTARELLSLMDDANPSTGLMQCQICKSFWEAYTGTGRLARGSLQCPKGCNKKQSK